jgi:PKD repeat protein
MSKSAESKAIVFGIIILFIGINVLLVFHVEGNPTKDTIEWIENFDDGDISDWTFENPYGSGNSPVTLGLSVMQSHSFPYSLLLDSPNADWYSGAAWGPTVPINLTKPYSVDFWFQFFNLHWFRFFNFGHISACIDQYYMGMDFFDDNYQHWIGPDVSTYLDLNKWTHFQFDVNPPASSFTMIVNGNKICTFNYTLKTPSEPRFHFYDAGGNAQHENDFVRNAFYDDIRVYQAGLNQPPIADFTWTTQTPKPNQTVNFNASSSYDPDGSIVSYAWDFDNDGQFDDKTGNYITWWRWSNIGTYPVSLKVIDDENESNIITKTVIIEGKNRPPVANASGPYSAIVGEPIIFSGSQSYDVDGTIKSYRWDFTNDSFWDTSWLTSPTREYTFFREFHGYVKLQVKDDFGVISSAIAKVDINKAPVANSPGTPGFELLFYISALAISIMLWKSKRNK